MSESDIDQAGKGDVKPEDQIDDDATIVVGERSRVDDDATLVRNRIQADDDATIVRYLQKSAKSGFTSTLSRIVGANG